MLTIESNIHKIARNTYVFVELIAAFLNIKTAILIVVGNIEQYILLKLEISLLHEVDYNIIKHSPPS